MWLEVGVLLDEKVCEWLEVGVLLDDMFGSRGSLGVLASHPGHDKSRPLPWEAARKMQAQQAGRTLHVYLFRNTQTKYVSAKLTRVSAQTSKC